MKTFKEFLNESSNYPVVTVSLKGTDSFSPTAMKELKKQISWTRGSVSVLKGDESKASSIEISGTPKETIEKWLSMMDIYSRHDGVVVDGLGETLHSIIQQNWKPDPSSDEFLNVTDLGNGKYEVTEFTRAGKMPPGQRARMIRRDTMSKSELKTYLSRGKYSQVK